MNRHTALGLAMIRVSRLEKRISNMPSIKRYAAGIVGRLGSLLMALVITIAVGV